MIGCRSAIEGVHVAQERDERRQLRVVEFERWHSRIRKTIGDDGSKLRIGDGVLELAAAQPNAGDTVAVVAVAAGALFRVETRPVFDIGARVILRMPLQRRTLGGDSTRGCQTEGAQSNNNPPHMRTLIRGNAALDNTWQSVVDRRDLVNRRGF